MLGNLKKVSLKKLIEAGKFEYLKAGTKLIGNGHFFPISGNFSKQAVVYHNEGSKELIYTMTTSCLLSVKDLQEVLIKLCVEDRCLILEASK